ncbi:synaptic vesicle glycoprotein 2C-like isoform X3 [Ischnura elegans]|uniref:synaptic vesicle glycoprotein 2C-like isoform X3 n=1 Tax=Ischnura elegans TaxID=197161 RepID=UPI001ED89D30|nr:synaptic vesicle glycoprotein 2C-like isoform X3 [Ischnura elegans]
MRLEMRGRRDSDCAGAMEDTKRQFIPKEGRDKSELGADFETAIGLTGVGKFNYFLMLICGSVFANAAIGIATISFVLPSAQCDFHLSSEDKGRLSASPNIGMLVGSCIWGLMADAKGRKWMMVSGLLLDAFCCFASSIAQSYWLFIVCRFFNGFGITAASTLVFAYMGEFLPSSKRDQMLCWLELFWSFGVVVLPALAWWVIPQTWSFVSAGGGFTFNSWRLFVAICGVPSILNACLLCTLPETPKFLMSKNKLDEAYVVFQKIHQYNKGKKTEYEVKALQPVDSNGVAPKGLDSLGMIEVPGKREEGAATSPAALKASSRRSRPARALANVASQTKALFTPPLLRSTLITFTVQIGLMSSYYTLILWFPDLFDRFERFETLYPNQTASICDVTARIAEQGGVDSLPCGADGEPIVPAKVFINALYVGIACIPTSIWLALCVDRLGKKFILVISLVTAGACTLGFNYVWTSTQNLILSCIFEAITGMTISALMCVVVELFPTNLRAFALALSLTIGRIGAITGNVAFGWLIDFNCVIPIVVGGVALIGSGLLCLAIPKVNQDQPM